MRSYTLALRASPPIIILAFAYIETSCLAVYVCTTTVASSINLGLSPTLARSSYLWYIYPYIHIVCLSTSTFTPMPYLLRVVGLEVPVLGEGWVRGEKPGAFLFLFSDFLALAHMRLGLALSGPIHQTSAPRCHVSRPDARLSRTRVPRPLRPPAHLTTSHLAIPCLRPACTWPLSIRAGEEGGRRGRRGTRGEKRMKEKRDQLPLRKEDILGISPHDRTHPAAGTAPAVGGF